MPGRAVLAPAGGQRDGCRSQGGGHPADGKINPLFNASGAGRVFTWEGTNELDASIIGLGEMRKRGRGGRGLKTRSMHPDSCSSDGGSAPERPASGSSFCCNGVKGR